MLTLDSVDLYYPSSKIDFSGDFKALMADCFSSEGDEYSRFKKDVVKPLGVEMVNVNHVRDQVKFGLNAQILGVDYFDGISIDNVENVFSELRKNLHIDFDSYSFLSESKTGRVDPCKMIPTDRRDEMIDALKNLSPRDSWVKIKNRGSGVTFKRPMKNSEVFYCYPKDKHISLAANSKKFIHHLGHEVYNDLFLKAQKMVRVENPLYTIDQKRKYLDVGKKVDKISEPVTLLSVLQSKENSIVRVFDSAVNVIQTIETIKERFNVVNSDAVLAYSLEHIYDDLKRKNVTDIEGAVLDAYKSFFNNRSWRYKLHLVRDIVNYFVLVDRGEKILNFENGLIAEFREKIA